MSIVIFGDLFSFPDGGAATNRVHSYAKGLKENGINIIVVCFLSTYSADNGVYEGIKYYYPFQGKKRSTYFIVRHWKKFKKYFATYTLLRKINKEDKITGINCWTNLLTTQLFAWLLSKLLGTKLIIEISEHPLRSYQSGKIRKIQGAIKLYLESRFCDGILCISRYLVDFYKVHGVSQEKLFLVPSTVIPENFSQKTKKPITGKYIGYFGSLSFKRDNVDMLINAFGTFTQHYPDVQLVLGGSSTPESKKQIQNLINTFNIQSKVKILEFLKREEILEYITNADILVMTRSKDLESAASYPSKLTEFLATGKPVISVNVGEISDFLNDSKNVFLVEPGDSQGLVDKLMFVYNNYEYAQQVGLKGKGLTSGVFNYNYQAKRITGFINSLYN